MKNVKYTEMFYSIQGEAVNTGKLCTWLRTFLCSLQCRGFGQVEPGNPETWEPQFPLIDVKNITDINHIPLPSTGCDSAYSWSAQFKHLVLNKTTRELATEIRATTPKNTFDGVIGHVFTGGEPLMQQPALAEIINFWIEDEDYPAWVGFETNVTQALRPELKAAIRALQDREVLVYFSMSPKLLHVAGEQPKKAIHIDLMADYVELCPRSYLKFVLNEDQRAWDQALWIVNALKAEPYPEYTDVEVWVMPVGANVGQQSDPAVGRIADKAIREYQWNVSPRVHVLIWGDDQIGR
ncbi:hypothetical protein pf16_86 [Pseudomonas phage pf16]|uniref:7-carboxy-7-deazaguanine synthase n=1 Tax=Pseudomonas phage pf16 TaxID=1815630 RepID=A0A1S5R3N0_9CAUD|nr:QueE-like radical SAM domain [Pseudomonas phage pf16]AND75009.1 hypothetical protein pf16_86 [Pseudomonas phage pf16]